MNTTIPCTVTDEDETVYADTTLDVVADWFEGWRETRTDPGEPAGYEVAYSRLNLTDDLRAIRTDCYRVQIQHGQPVFVFINPDLLPAPTVDLDSDDLHEALVSYLED